MARQPWVYNCIKEPSRKGLRRHGIAITYLSQMTASRVPRQKFVISNRAVLHDWGVVSLHHTSGGAWPADGQQRTSKCGRCAITILRGGQAAVATISWVLSEGDKRDSESNMPDGEGVSPFFWGVQVDTPSLDRGRSYFAPEPASRTRPRRTLPHAD